MDTKFQILEDCTEIQIHIRPNGISIKSRGISESWSEGVTLTANGLSREGILQFCKSAEEIIGINLYEQVYNILS